MTKKEISNYLCIYHPKHPEYKFTTELYEENEKPKPGGDCCCDNCYYGRYELALELFKQIDKNKKRK